MMLPPQLHKILAVAFFMLPFCAQGKPAGFLPRFPLKFFFGDASNDQQIPDVTPQPDNENGDDIHELEHRISRLEGVLRLNKMITESGGKIFATNGKSADFEATVETCKEAGGSIATPRNPGENDAILYFLQTLEMEAVMVDTILSPWEILLVIFAAVLVMSLLMLLPPAAVVLWRMQRAPQISLHGSV
ncbi:uncharacterized protein M8220_005756 isoform 2-T3 [Acridotheres tristis]